MRSAVGKAYLRPQGVSNGSPKSSQSFSTMDFMRGMLLHWEMMKEQSASHLSWRRMRMPSPVRAQSVRYSPRMTLSRAAS